ncbi:acyltransferase family protein [Hoeflea sp.]|uniref:acyltransferase family protein n=1 Tax=Hoeflea sp. TaxID=1940281 RepID=UPI003A8E51C9
MSAAENQSPGRVGWVDVAKGVCIVFVVMMHSTLGVEKALGDEGFMGLVVAFAKPFRMPDFFLISGLFLGLVINRPWRLYLDRKVVHFAYFYALWLSIQFAFKAPVMMIEAGPGPTLAHYLISYVEPFGTLWFIYLLPIFFVVTRLLVTVPKWIVLVAAAALNAAPVMTGWLVIDEFAARYVFFFAGFAAAPLIFRAASWVQAHRLAGLWMLAGWAVVNGVLVFAPVPMALAPWGERLSDLPLVGLGLGFAGALAIIFSASLLATCAGPVTRFLRHAGENSIVVYLAFFLPMAVTRTALIRLMPELGAGWISVLVTAVATVSPLILLWMISRSGHGWFLFRRPGWAILAEPPARAHLARA